MNELDQALRRHDPDRWLSSRFVTDPDKRSKLVALYALDDAWARVAAQVTTPLAGEIRLAWWRDAVESFAAGGPAEHPALEALGREAAARLQPWLQSVIEAGHADLEALEDQGDAAAEARIDAGEGLLMAAAASLLDPFSAPESIRHAARAWGWARRRHPVRPPA
ncbi:squalene/phytoene synthase family protein, partial [Mycobacterium tuberculosis]